MDGSVELETVSTEKDKKMTIDEDDEEEEIVEEEEEEEEVIDQPASGSFSYRKVGVIFLFLAIIFAVIFAVVPSTLSTRHLITNVKVGIIFFLLLGAFLLLLLSCLFFTYYMGGSRDAWDDPVVTTIRLNFSNVTAILGIFVEFVQICSFSFHQDSQFVGSASLVKMRLVAVPYLPGSVFRIVYWVMFVLSFSPYIFVITVRIVIYSITRRKGEQEAAAFVHKYQQKIYSILWILVNTIYLPVISTMFGGVDCTFTQADTTPSFDSDSGIRCFSATHFGYMACSLIALVIYYPAASFAQAQTQNISDIKYKPRIVFIFVQLKVLLAAVYVFFAANYVRVYLPIVLAIDCVFLFLNAWSKPCLILWITQLRTILYAVCAWSCVCSLISLTAPDVVPLSLLIAGWTVIIIGGPIVLYLYERIKPAIFTVNPISSLPSSSDSSNKNSSSSV
eukprot:TRINITY_DN3226_c1_g1_i1.p1 TRINITY_DN3226_c1_g1~~TRINITY_DN3226_c1_g1_i1.p1  ORF type:complete len:448 (-),score=68.92 TRINITY_DN3226_c1_g1_i1:77-1420(-)